MTTERKRANRWEGHIAQDGRRYPKDPLARIVHQVDVLTDTARRADHLESYLDRQLFTFQPYTKGWWDTLEEIGRVRTERLALGPGAIAMPWENTGGGKS